MLRSCVARRPGASLIAGAASSSAHVVVGVPVASVRSMHSSAARMEKRQVDGSWVSDNTRIIDRPNHFHPTESQPIVKRPTREPFPDRRPHDKISPRVNPAQGTHTLLRQRTDIRMQFQLEPVTRTNVKGNAAAGSAKIQDYRNAEVFTRAPWPCYREIVLNRAAHHHALNPAMIQQLNHLAQSLELNKDITAGLMISHHIQTQHRPKNYDLGVDKATGLKRIAYEKTFSAGMDLQTLLSILKEAREKKHAAAATNSTVETDVVPGNPELSKYFRSLYSFAFNMSRIRTPLVIAMDGLAVGAGAGFALHSRYRVATENTRISFPQASLGWFPDAGASYILPRLDGRLGLFLALTGWQVRGLDATRLGFCTHYCESDELHRFGRRIGDSSLNYQFAEDTIEQSFGMFNENGPSYLPMPMHDLHEVINEVFDADSVDGILLNMLHRLQAIKSKGADASAKDLATAAFVTEMQKRMMASSPTGLKVTFELLRLTQFLPLEKCLKLEYRLSQGLLSNLSNPLTAEIFNAPNFVAKTLAQVTPDFIDRIFAENADEDQELNLDYPEKKQPHWYI